MFDIKSPSGLSSTNDHFANNSFVNGFVVCLLHFFLSFFSRFTPSHDDAVMAAEIARQSPLSLDFNRYPHIGRWYKNMRSYTDGERDRYSKCCCLILFNLCVAC